MRQLRRLLLAAALTVVLAVVGMASARATMLPVPVDGGVPGDPLPGSHYVVPPPRATPMDPVQPLTLLVPWQYAGPALFLLVVALVFLLRAHRLHHAGHIRRL